MPGDMGSGVLYPLPTAAAVTAAIDVEAEGGGGGGGGGAAGSEDLDKILTDIVTWRYAIFHRLL
jgi:hypothetical protein